MRADEIKVLRAQIDCLRAAEEAYNERPLRYARSNHLSARIVASLAEECEEDLAELMAEGRRDAEHAIGLDGRCVACVAARELHPAGSGR